MGILANVLEAVARFALDVLLRPGTADAETGLLSAKNPARLIKGPLFKAWRGLE